jgi:hypothetical protein
MVESNFREISAVVPHGVKSLPPWGTAAGAWLRQQGGAAQRQDPQPVRLAGG